MPLFDIPVVIPYRLDNDDGGVLHPVQIRTVASGVPAALATAEVLAYAHGRLRHPGHQIQVIKERAKVGAAGPQVDGPYAYVLTRGSLIHHLSFPARIDSQAGEQLHGILEALDGRNVFGLIIDCAPLVYINTVGLTALSAHARMTQLFRVPATIAKVLEIVGLNRMIRTHANLTAALESLVQNMPVQPALST